MSKIVEYIRALFFIIAIMAVAPSMIRGLMREYTKLLKPKAKVGILRMKDPLCNAAPLIKRAKELFKDADIKAILITMDCPGGAAGSSQALFNELKELKKAHPKPLLTLVENICASGGYYVACASDLIIATPSAFVGSIGVYIQQPHFKKLIERYDIEYSVVKSGSFKTTGSSLLDQTPEQVALLQSLTDDTYQQFIQDVAQERHKLSLTKHREWADGRIFSGRQAHALGLIDELGSLSMAERIIRERALIEEEIEWVYPSKASAFLDFFTSDDEEASVTCMGTTFVGTLMRLCAAQVAAEQPTLHL